MARGPEAPRSRSSPISYRASVARPTSRRSGATRTPAARPLPNAVQYGGSIYDSYSQGASLANYDVAFIVGNAIINDQLPPDPDGIYVVLTSGGRGREIRLRYAVLRLSLHDERERRDHEDSLRRSSGSRADEVQASGSRSQWRHLRRRDGQRIGERDRSTRSSIRSSGAGTTSSGSIRPTNARGTSARHTARPTAHVPTCSSAAVDDLLQRLWVAGAKGFCTLDVNTAR